MVIIRLARAGAKKSPFYHLVVTDSRKPRDSNYVEQLGYFNPIARGQETRLHFNLEKISYWQGVGAQLSDRAKRLIKEYKKTVPVVAEATEKKVEKATDKPAKKEAAEKAVKKTTATKKAAPKATAAKKPSAKKAVEKDAE